MSTSDDSDRDKGHRGADAHSGGAEKTHTRRELATKGAGGKKKGRSRIESSSSGGGGGSGGESSSSIESGSDDKPPKKTKRLETAGGDRSAAQSGGSGKEKGKREIATKSCTQPSPSSSKSRQEGADKKKGKKRERQTNADGEEMIPLGANRFITVREFRGKTLIDIRQYYVDNKSGSGELKPTPKGISLSPEQYEEMKKVLSEVDEKLEEI